MKIPVVDTNGNPLREIEADDAVFGIEPNVAVLHQAYVAQLANRRSGNAHTKVRAEVRGSRAKLRRQKGLGRARVGSAQSGTRRGGGVIFGPRSHSFAKDLPRNMKRLALRSALSSHARDGDLVVVEGLVPGEPKTKSIHATLQAIGAARAALLVSGDHEPNLMRASKNLAYAKATAAAGLNVVDLINAHRLVMTEDAVRKAETLWGGDNLKVSRGNGKQQEES